MRGQIKSLIKKKGYGFIQDENGQDMFFHRSDLKGVSFYSLHKGDKVTFSVAESKKGARAVDVCPAGTSSSSPEHSSNGEGSFFSRLKRLFFKS